MVEHPLATRLRSFPLQVHRGYAYVRLVVLVYDADDLTVVYGVLRAERSSYCHQVVNGFLGVEDDRVKYMYVRQRWL